MWCSYLGEVSMSSEMIRQQSIPGLEHFAPTEAKECEECGVPFGRPLYSHSQQQWIDMRFCSPECANRWRARERNPLFDPNIRQQHGEKVSAGYRALPRYWENQAERIAQRERGIKQRKRAERNQVLKPMLRDVERLLRRLELPCQCKACLAERNRRYRRRWRKEKPGAARAENRRWRALNRGAEGHSSAQQDQWRFEYYGGRCAYCRGELGHDWHWDHVIALANGGTNWPANLRPSCPSCNMKKRNDDWRAWVGG